MVEALHQVQEQRTLDRNCIPDPAVQVNCIPEGQAEPLTVVTVAALVLSFYLGSSDSGRGV